MTALTPVLTIHARTRCAEMGISTKVAKQIVRHANLRRPDHPGSERIVAQSDWHPAYIVVFEDRGPDVPPVIVTVGFNDRLFLARNGTTCVRAAS